MRVEHWRTEVDGELTEATLKAKLLARGFSATRYTYPPGTFFPDHQHGMDKIDAVLAGRFSMSLEDQSIVLGPGDMLFVPRRVVHSAKVVGDEPVVSLDAIRTG